MFKEVESCMDCPFMNTDIENGSSCNLDDSCYLWELESHPTNCPLIEGEVTVYMPFDKAITNLL